MPTMPLTLDDLQATAGYSPVNLSPSPENERFFANASPCYEPEHTPLMRQILFWFTHAPVAVGVTLLLDPSLHACLTCCLRRHMESFQMEEDDRNTMIEFARMKAAAMESEYHPADGVVIIIVSPRGEGESMEEDDDDDDDDYDDDEVEFEVLFPADEGAVEALTRKKVKSAGCLETCAICLEEFGEGEEAFVMPCSHVFHGDCIKTWLKKTNSCPICRFKLPAAADGRYVLQSRDSSTNA